MRFWLPDRRELKGDSKCRELNRMTFLQGTCGSPGAVCPSEVGPTQMQHFKSKDGFNIFRLPVGWQYLVNNQLSGPLDKDFFGTYDAIVQSCLQTGAKCIVDIVRHGTFELDLSYY